MQFATYSKHTDSRRVQPGSSIQSSRNSQIITLCSIDRISRGIQIQYASIWVQCGCNTQSIQKREIRATNAICTMLQPFRLNMDSTWVQFSKYSDYPLQSRAKLFEAVVSTVVLYACSSWTLTEGDERTLRTVWRKMLRFCFRIHRRKVSEASGEQTLETWVDYMQRSTRAVEEIAHKLRLESWPRTFRRRKWRFAGKTARNLDGRWSHELLDWRPSIGLGRDVGRPVARWSGAITKFAGGNWMQLAADEDLWAILEEGFVCHGGT